MTTALYRRYRPDTFQQVIGQEHVTEPLMAALRANRVNHAYLFSGPRGCGKTTSARILARCLNCEQGPTDTPCGVCPSCVDLATGGSGSLDVVEIDAASHNSVEDARELRERASFAPARDTYKIFILDEAHMVTNQGFNALLKLVEEPPPHVKFIFATTEPEKVIGTIRSRTHHYPFRLVPPPVLEDYLRQLCHSEKVEVGDGVLPLVVRAGGGSVRDTLSVLDQLIGGSDGKVDYEQAIGLLGFTDISLLDQCVDAIAARDGAACFEVVQRVVSSGHDPRRFVEDLLQRLRDLLILAVAGDQAQAALGSLPVDQLERMQVQARALGAGQLSRCADMCAAALGTMVGATSPRLQLELLMARLLVVGLAQPTTAPRSLPGGGSQSAGSVQAGQDGAGRISVGSGRAPEGSGREAARAALQRANMAIPVLAEAPSGPGVEGGVGMNVPVAPNAPAAPSVPGSVPGTPSVPAGPSAASAASSAPAARSAAGAGPATAGSAAQTRSAAQAANSAAVRPAQGPGAGSSSPSELIRNRWGEVLAKVKAASRVTNALVGANAQPGKVSGETFTLIFASPGLVRSFNSGRHPQVVAGALYEALGLRLQVQAVSDGEAATVAEPGSAPYPPSAASATHVGGRQGRGNETADGQTASRQPGQGAESGPAQRSESQRAESRSAQRSESQRAESGPAQRSKPTRREATPAREAAPSAWDQPAPASWDEDWEVVQIPNSGGNTGLGGAEVPVDQASSDSHGGAPTGGPQAAGGVPTGAQAGDPASIPAGGPTDGPQTMGGPQATGSPQAGGQDDWAGGGQFDQTQDSVYFGGPAQGEGQARGQFDAVPGGTSPGLATVTAGSAAIAAASAASASSHLAPASPIAPATPMASAGSSAAAAALAASRANHPSNGAASANTWKSTWEAAPIPTPDNYMPVAPEPELATVHRLHPLPALPNGGAQSAPAPEAAHSWQPDPGASSRMAQAIAAARAAADAGGVVDDEEDMPSMDDADADESGAVGIEVVKRLLGAKVIEEVTVRADDR